MENVIIKSRIGDKYIPIIEAMDIKLLGLAKNRTLQEITLLRCTSGTDANEFKLTLLIKTGINDTKYLCKKKNGEYELLTKFTKNQVEATYNIIGNAYKLKNVILKKEN